MMSGKAGAGDRGEPGTGSSTKEQYDPGSESQSSSGPWLRAPVAWGLSVFTVPVLRAGKAC